MSRMSDSSGGPEAATRWRGLAPLILALLVAALAVQWAGADRALAQGSGYEVEPPEVVLSGVPFSVDVSAPAGAETAEIVVGGESYEADVSGGSATVEGVVVDDSRDFSISVVEGGETVAEGGTESIPGWFSVVPPLLAIVVALVSRQVLPALFLGIYSGAAMVYGLSLEGLWYGLLDTVGVYAIEALAPPSGDTGHASIIVFSLMIGGMVGIISRNGGMKGIVNLIVGRATDARKGQAATGLLGLAIFFDDYANTLVVGNTMRSVTDRLRVSREKLAYIVDSTTAPVATLALVSTWIGFQVGLIDDAVRSIEGFDAAGYTVFLNSIPYSFYPLLAILFVFAVVMTGRDFGPMLRAERRARRTGEVLREGAAVDSAAAGSDELEPKSGAPERAFNAILPIMVLIGTSLAGLYITGDGGTLREIIGSADPFASLVWGSLLSVLAAVALSVGQRILTVEETMNAWYTGLRAMLLVMIILVLAWSLSGVTETLHTGDYLVSVLGESLPVALVPALIFIVAAATAFSTGTSWGTMGILIPLTVPLTWAIMQTNGMASPEHYHIMYAAVSTVLAGAVWGDHCSPISDTTVLSSMASGCDHIDHVRTQLPYALLVGGVSLALGLLPVGLGLAWWLALPLTAAAILGCLLLFGARTDHKTGEPDDEENEERETASTISSR